MLWNSFSFSLKFYWNILWCTYHAIVLLFVNSLNFQRDKFAQTLSMLNYLHQYVLDCTGIWDSFLPYHAMGIDAYFCALHSQKNLPCTEILEHQVPNDLYEAQVEIRSYSSLGAIVYHISGNHRLEQKELPNENYQV